MAIQPTNPIIRVAENDTTLPSTGFSNKLEPITSIQTVGFDATTLVSAEELNYILDNFGQWLEYQKTVADSQVNAGDGLDSDAGTIGEGQTLSLGTPSTTGSGSNNSVTTDSHTHALSLDTNNISILTGSILNGETIPLPAGYTEGQCRWMVSFDDINVNSGGWDIPESGTFVHLKSNCYTTGRVVTSILKATNTGEGLINFSASANYIIIGVK